MTSRCPTLPAMCAVLLVMACATSTPAVAVSVPDSVVDLPAVTSDLGVGTFTAFWTDSSRTDTTASGVGPRSVAVQFWYPAEDCHSCCIGLFRVTSD